MDGAGIANCGLKQGRRVERVMRVVPVVPVKRVVRVTILSFPSSARLKRVAGTRST